MREPRLSCKNQTFARPDAEIKAAEAESGARCGPSEHREMSLLAAAELFGRTYR